MSWESGNQLQTTAPSLGASQSYMEVRLASRASRESSMPRGSPVLPEVNCTKRPGCLGRGRDSSRSSTHRRHEAATGPTESSSTRPGSHSTCSRSGDGAHVSDLGQVLVGVHSPGRMRQRHQRDARAKGSEEDRQAVVRRRRAGRRRCRPGRRNPPATHPRVGAYAELGQRERSRAVREAVDTRHGLRAVPRARRSTRLMRGRSTVSPSTPSPSAETIRPVGRDARVPSSPATGDDMQLDIHVPRFTWPGGPEAIGPTFTSLGDRPQRRSGCERSR